MTLEFRSVPTVELIDWMPRIVEGSHAWKRADADNRVAQAARVSSGTDRDTDQRNKGLLKMLMRDRHGSPFEHVVFTWRIETPIFVAREFFRHRIACLAGDTKIRFDTEAGNGKWKTIEEHWDHWHNGVADSLGRRRKLPSIYAAKVRSYNEDTLTAERSTVLDVVQSGVKTVFELTTSRGFTITASADHRFFGPKGWFKLSELSPGDVLYVQGKTALGPRKAGVSQMLRQGIQNWVTGIREDVFSRDEFTCQTCGVEGTANTLRADHRIPVATSLKLALDFDNLQTLCIECDRGKTDREQLLANRTMQYASVAADSITSIKPAGEQMTYDLVLDNPHHNFLANGIVVHNSYNEVSARYTEMKGIFYVPARHRPLVQEGKPGAYTFTQGTDAQWMNEVNRHQRTAERGWGDYQESLEDGVAREVARNHLPFSIYTSFYVTMNLRSLLNFLSLRLFTEDSSTPTFPLFEISQVAELMEEQATEIVPQIMKNFNEGGRVAP